MAIHNDQRISRRKLEKDFFFVDPMSYNNLAIYDYSLISNISDLSIQYFCNVKYDYKKLDIRCHSIYDYAEKKGIYKILSYIQSQIKLIKEIRNNNVALVHFQWLKIPFIDYLVLKLIKKKTKIIYTAHNVLPHGSGKKYEWIYRRIYKVTDAIIVHSPNTKTDLIEKLNVSTDKIHVIPHGILDMWHGVDTFKVDRYELEFKKEFGLKDRLVFSALGNIHDYKGIDIIVDAWQKSNITNDKNIKLIIAGKGRCDRLKELNANNNVAIINRFLNTEEFLALLKLTDYMLLPYKQISQSGILLTALNEKKKVIVSKVGGLTDPFTFGNIGYVLEELNSEELNRIIVKAVGEQNWCPDQELWKQISDYYDWGAIGRKTQNLYENILK